MNRNGRSVDQPGASIEAEREETRRSMLAKAGLVAGGAGLASLVRPEQGHGYHQIGQMPFDARDFEGFNNVKHFGALGNGTTNDRQAIQNCIDASAGIGPNPRPGSVYFPPGTYLVNSTLYMRSGTALVGHGALSVVKATTDHGGQIFLNADVTNGNNDILIDNLVLDSNNRTTGFDTLRVTAENGYCERIFVRRVEIKNQKKASPAFILQKVRFAEVQDCHIHDCVKGGLQMQKDCSHIIVQGNLIHDVGGDDCIATWNYQGTQPKRISIVGNICIMGSLEDPGSTGSVIGLKGGTELVVVGNLCHGGYRCGIEVTTYKDANQDSTVENVLIADNVILDAGSTGSEPAPPPFSTGVGGGSGILVRAFGPGNIKWVNIKDNTIIAPRYDGVRLGVDSANGPGTVTDVAICGNQIRISQTASHVNLTHPGAGISSISPKAEVSNIRVSDNDIRNGIEAGIRVIGPNNKRWDIQNNRVFDSGKSTSARRDGIVIDRVDGLMAIGNRSQDTRQVHADKTQEFGLSMMNVTGYVLVTTNDVSGNYQTANGISAPGTAGETYVYENLGSFPLRTLA